MIEKVDVHGPGVDVPDTVLEEGGELESTGDGVLHEAIVEAELPEDGEAGSEEMPKYVCTVVVLGEDKALTDTGPDEEVNCV